MLDKNKPQTKKIRHLQNCTHVTVRLSQGQYSVLTELVPLTGQTKTDLIREAISAHLYPLYQRLKHKESEEEI